MTQEGRAMTVASGLYGASPRLASPGRARLAAGLALAALLPGSHSTAHAQESATARIARENLPAVVTLDRKSTRLNSSHSQISYAVFCLKKKKQNHIDTLLHRVR